MDTVDRIFELVDKKYKEQRDFAKEISVTPSVVSEWRRRKSSSYRRIFPTVANALDTTVQWLATGEGPKTRAEALSRAPTIGLSQTALLVAKAYDQAGPGIQESIRKLLDVEDIPKESGHTSEAM